MNLRQYLRKNRLSVIQFAKILGITRQAVYHYINRTKSPTLEIALKIHKKTNGVVKLKSLLKK